MKTLTPIEIRILGSLVEKDLTTPEYYPMSVNAVTNACNQKNNRDPVTHYDEVTVSNELENLKDKLLVGKVLGIGSRVPKYRHLLGQAYLLYESEIPILTVMMLRGPQTIGELRSRSASMKEYPSLEVVEEVVNRLIEREVPLVRQLPVQPGKKENRYMHLLGGEPDLSVYLTETKSVHHESDKLKILEEQILEMKSELDLLKSQFADFRKQFE